jgi:D-alanyl-lipoteichoic acid acyltransferase DltB (MBOAT superfamily)
VTPLTGIVVFTVGALIYGLIVPARWRGWVLLAASVIAIYWLQPSSPVRPVDFVLPTATLLLGIVGWLITRQPPTESAEHNTPKRILPRQDMIAAGLIAALIVLLAAVGGLLKVTPSPPPDVIEVGIALLGVGAVIATFAAMLPTDADRQQTISIFILLVIAIFVVLKADSLAIAFSAWLRAQTGRLTHLASVRDIEWLGFSYFAFRLIHTLRDRQAGKLPALSLREYVTYLIFFPAYTAGPIDRVERFVKDYRALDTTPHILTAPRVVEGVSRIVIGIFKKFVVADSLALVALNATNAMQAQTGSGLWVLLYAFAFRIYFDFSGYSDIAIGIGRLFAINLPENFDRPYLKDNITAFWQSWHMTLSTWARFYVFTPLSRVLMNRPRKPSPTVVVLVTQVATMVVIGLWHDITLNFVIWGLWHGIGLWLHKLFTDRTRVFYQNLNERPRLRRAASWAGILLTFHYVALGWVWFALPEPTLSLDVLKRLFGR